MLALLLVFAACAGKESDMNSMTDEQLYAKGIGYIAKENYDEAIVILQKLEETFPYSPYLLRTWLSLGYAQYASKKYQEAADTFTKTARMQPGAATADYANYMLAKSIYVQIQPINREQKSTESALVAMERTIRQYPDSPYAEDLKPKVIVARNTLAAKQMFIARELLRGKNFIGALNRYQTVIAKHDTTIYAAEALFRTVEIYNILDQRDDALNMLKLLETNYADSEWTAMARKILGI